MNVYMIIDRETEKTGTCYNLEELVKVVGQSRHTLLANKPKYRYGAVRIGGKQLRQDYQMIDKVYEWFENHSGRKVTGWKDQSQRMFLTAWDYRRESRSNTTAMVNMLFQSNKKYGTRHELDKEINMDDDEYIETYYKGL